MRWDACRAATNAHHKPPDFSSDLAAGRNLFEHLGNFKMGGPGAKPPGNFEGFESRKTCFRLRNRCLVSILQDSERINFIRVS